VLAEPDGTPLNDPKADSPEAAWLTAVMVISQKLRDFEREVAKRQAAQEASS
jgi:hypothetical protein